MSRVVYLLVLSCLCFALLVEGGAGGNNHSPCGIRSKRVPNSVDFIVVGGGTAGSILASRLTANPFVTVLVIEVGKDNSNSTFTQDPNNWATIAGSPLDWDDIVALGEPRVFQDLQKRHITSGRTFGGSSAINSAMFVRSQDTWNRWSDAGNSGWDYESVLPLFKGIETSPRYATDPFYHGNNGPLHTSGDGHNADNVLVNAALASGLTYVSDWNGAEQITGPQGSVGFEEKTTVNGIRQNSYQSFLKPNLCRRNLYVMDASQALRVNFDSSKRARSVTWIDHLTANVYTTKALHEVVLSAGTVRTSQLLRLSGIGDADELNGLGVNVISNLPGVGQNLQDHPIHVINVVSNTNASTCDQDPLIQGMLWIRTENQDATDPRPDIQVISATSCPNLYLLVYVVKPRSRGSVLLFSNDPTQRPGVRMNFFEDQRDLDTMISGVRKVAEIYGHLGGHVTTYNISDTAAMESYILGTPYTNSDTNSGMHLVGTAKMGPSSDPYAVVDSRLRVYGVSRLRVADASIMPEITSGNTQAPSYVIGAKAAEMLLEDNY